MKTRAKHQPLSVALIFIFAVAFLLPSFSMPATAQAATNVKISTQSADFDADYITLSGKITDDGGVEIEEFGFYYGTNRKNVGKGEDGSSDWAEAKGRQRNFTLKLDLDDLDSNKVYYYMAYAIDDDDNFYYGSIKSFNTADAKISDKGAPEVTTDAASAIKSASATLNGTIDSFGDDYEIIEYGFYYGTSSSPSTKKKVGDDDDYIDEDDDFYYNLTGLKADTRYYFKAYAKNNEGIAYGKVRSFYTEKGEDIKVTTITPTTKDGSATLYGIITDDGGLSIESYGFYYGQTTNPTTKKQVGSSIKEDVEFNYKLTNLKAGTYYVKAYATNDEGTAYGSLQSFTVSSTAAAPSIFTIGSKAYLLSGANQTMDVAPYIKNSRTYMPIRYVAYAMGLTDEDIVWNEVARTVVLTKDSNTVILIIGSRTMFSNGTAITMDVAPEITGDRTCLPIAWVASAFGNTANWDANARTVTIR